MMVPVIPCSIPAVSGRCEVPTSGTVPPNLKLIGSWVLTGAFFYYWSKRGIHDLEFTFYQHLFESQNGVLTPMMGHLQTQVLEGLELSVPFIVEEVKRSLFQCRELNHLDQMGCRSYYFNFIGRLWDTIKDSGEAIVIKIEVSSSVYYPDSQSAFLPQRLKTHNLLMAYEAHHFIKNEKQGCHVVQTRFQPTLGEDYYGLCYFGIVFLGDQTSFIFPGKGLKQGDLLSPYHNYYIHGRAYCSYQRSLPQGRYQGTISEGRNLQHPWDVRGYLPRKVFGLTNYHKPSKRVIFTFSIDRVKFKIVDWKLRLLTKVGKKVFITFVLQAILTYDIQCFLLPIQT
ncbi:hypothetical protein LIER_21180 [Lithospermum erythrorhizon]|uniref:Uncharacterized protein n=1 Tax=Lithospermum erythrorhizon TaxID=34254 RepID=A0AAV3QRT4_LITER